MPPENNTEQSSLGRFSDPTQDPPRDHDLEELSDRIDELEELVERTVENVDRTLGVVLECLEDPDAATVASERDGADVETAGECESESEDERHIGFQ